MPKFMKSLNIISRCQYAFRAKHSESGISAIHHSLVLAICREPGRSQDELAKDICIDKSGVARALASLEANGFVERKTDPENKRKTLVFPTEKLLDKIHASKTLEDIGLESSLLPMTFKASKDIRDKYVLPRLLWDIGVLDEVCDKVFGK